MTCAYCGKLAVAGVSGYHQLRHGLSKFGISACQEHVQWLAHHHEVKAIQVVWFEDEVGFTVDDVLNAHDFLSGNERVADAAFHIAIAGIVCS